MLNVNKITGAIHTTFNSFQKTFRSQRLQAKYKNVLKSKPRKYSNSGILCKCSKKTKQKYFDNFDDAYLFVISHEVQQQYHQYFKQNTKCKLFAI